MYLCRAEGAAAILERLILMACLKFYMFCSFLQSRKTNLRPPEIVYLRRRKLHRSARFDVRRRRQRRLRSSIQFDISRWLAQHASLESLLPFSFFSGYCVCVALDMCFFFCNKLFLFLTFLSDDVNARKRKNVMLA